MSGSRMVGDTGASCTNGDASGVDAVLEDPANTIGRQAYAAWRAHWAERRASWDAGSYWLAEYRDLGAEERAAWEAVGRRAYDIGKKQAQSKEASAHSQARSTKVCRSRR